MSNHFAMLSHYMLVYNRDRQMMAVPVPTMCKKPHIEDTICPHMYNIPVHLTLNDPLVLQQPNQPIGKFGIGLAVTVVTLWALMSLATLYLLLRDFFYSTGHYDPQFCVRDASASYYQ